MIIDVVAGARPNFVKVAPLFRAAAEFPGLTLRLVHTGQHYDDAMSGAFLRELQLPKPSCQLTLEGRSHAHQTASVMIGYEEWCEKDAPDYCVVVGDVNSTLACALVCAKLGVPLAHVEAGLRSFDRSMPEEVNRVATDSVADLYFATEAAGVENLLREGRPRERIHLVGNVMIDSLAWMLPKARASRAHEARGLKPGGYIFVTLHRPSNVDDEHCLAAICRELIWLSEQAPVVFPVHPRTRNKLREYGLHDELDGRPELQLIEPVGYLDALSLVDSALAVVTDSGGLQEETSFLGVRCMTLRHNTERPVTIELGTNTLIGDDWGLFRRVSMELVSRGPVQEPSPIPWWDGRTSHRILEALIDER
jgi:UDP-N-acetylglucosamine 2-epimerase (non-hydrolysing)